jgi:branched-chain amino acid transport system ATP-binding protein
MTDRASDAAPLLEIAHASVRFGGLVAVDDVSLRLDAGEICALIGPNGAGKTTLFNAVAGYAPISEGRILLQGVPIEGLAPHEIAAKGVRRTFQNGGLFGHLSALENVLVGLHTETRGGLLGAVLGIARVREAEEAATAEGRALLGLMGLGHLANEPASALSGGQQRMVEIGRAIAANPPLLLLDEPAVGLAPPMRARLGEIVRELARTRNVGILLIEHAIELVMAVSDRVVVLSNGAKVADGTPDAVRADRAVLEAYLGHA